MDAFKLEAFKIALFILPGIITLRVKAALSISAPSKPLNTVIDGLVFTLLDHAVFGTLRAAAASLSEDSLTGRLKAFVDAIGAPAKLPGELGRAFVDAGGFPIVLIAVVVGIGLGAVPYHGWDFRLLRLLRLTNRTGENLVWAETLTKSAGQAYALVACKDGSRFIGEIDTFSEEAGNFRNPSERCVAGSARRLAPSDPW